MIEVEQVNKYRIVKDNYSGYEVQIKRWWFPIWLQVGLSNTHRTIEDAEAFVEGSCSRAVKYL